MNWVKPEFNEFLAPPPKKVRIDEKQKPSITVGKEETCESVLKLNKMVNLRRFRPKFKGDLVVNKKKLEEVEHWLKNLSDHCSLLLLTGPPGCGKLESVIVLCKSMNIDCVEWINPATYEYDKSNSSSYRSELTIFEDFILRASRYTNVLFSESRRVVIIKDVPNCFLRDSSVFHGFIEKFYCIDKINIIFIISNVTLSRDLFPEQLKAMLPLKCIQFNPLTQKAIASALNTFVQSLEADDRRKGSEYIESVSLSCNGDLRNGLTTLHFLLSKGSAQLTGKISNQLKKQKIKPKGKTKTGALDFIHCDNNVDIFHNLGRVLYAKSENGKLVHNPQDVADSFTSSPGLFINMLHENYLNTFSSIHDVAKASTNLSISDLLLHTWKENIYEFSSFRGCGVSVASYGLMVVNTKPVKKFQQFNKGKANDHTLYNEAKMILDVEPYYSRSNDVVLDISPYAVHIPYSELGRNEVIKKIGRF